MKKNYGGVLINEAILSQMNVSLMLEREGCDGLGLLVQICLYLKKCYHSIGLLDKNNIHVIARNAHKQDATVVRFIKKWGIFRILGDGRFFVLERFRKNFGFSTDVSEREADVIGIYGNGIKKEPEEYTKSHPVAEEPKLCTFSSSSKNEAELVEKDSQNKSETSEKLLLQQTDNKQDTRSLCIDRTNSIGIGVIRKGNNNHIPTTSSKEQSPSDVDGDESSFKFFEEIYHLGLNDWHSIA